MIETDEEALSFYVGVREGEFADLEAVSTAAIAWSQALRGAAVAIYPGEDIRVSLIAAERGSSNWLARIERSGPNAAAKRMVKGWKSVPLVVRMGLGLVVVVPVTAVPTLEWWTGTQSFSKEQLKQMEQVMAKARSSPAVEAPRRDMYRALQRDPKITGVGTGIPFGPHWKPTVLIPSSQFAEADGLFEIQKGDHQERVVPVTIDVILVAPQLENKPRMWTFRQEGIPGSFRALMNDRNFLAALEEKAVKEQFRARIPMRIRMEVHQRLSEDGEWKVTRRGREIVEVISPQTDPS